MIILIKIILIIKLFYLYQLKNIILPFQKITIEDFNGRKTINDIIAYNIFTNISIGTPPQIIAHFINQNENFFQFKKIKLSYYHAKMNKFLGDFENLTNFWFDSEKSSTFFIDNENVCSDIYYFNSLNGTIIKAEEFKHNIELSEAEDKYRCGVIGINKPSNSNINYIKEYISFINELKEKELITEYSFSFLYNEENDLFNYNNQINLGLILIGESPHIFKPDKYNKEDELINPGIDWAILVNEVNFNSFNGNYTEYNIEMKFCFTSGFINIYLISLYKLK